MFMVAIDMQDYKWLDGNVRLFVSGCSKIMSWFIVYLDIGFQ